MSEKYVYESAVLERLRHLEDTAAEIAALREACQALLDAQGAVFGTEFSNELRDKAVTLARAALKGESK